MTKYRGYGFAKNITGHINEPAGDKNRSAA